MGSPAITANLDAAPYDPVLGDFPVWVRIVRAQRFGLVREGEEYALSHDTAYWLIEAGIAIEIRRFRVSGGRYTPDSEDDPFWQQ